MFKTEFSDNSRFLVHSASFCVMRFCPCGTEDTINSRRALSRLVGLVERRKGVEGAELFQGVLPQNWGGKEPNRTVICVVLKASANDRHTSGVHMRPTGRYLETPDLKEKIKKKAPMQ
ncbi:hypothetical protein TNCV_3158861 [Trichonephila clavipes]|nr:hypothetical protein TNCV_3158861 [Trichonephila clavipes]